MIHFSDRTHWDAPENRLSCLLEEIKRSGKPWINLAESNPTRCGFVYPDAILRALSDPGALRYDPDPKGVKDARRAVCEYYRKRGCTVGEDHVILTASTSEAYSYLFRLLANGGDAILFPRPSYPLFQFLADLNDARLEFYDLRYRGGQWMMDEALFQNAAPSGTKAVVIVNPNNPTGSYVKTSEVSVLTAFCRKNDLALISDEVFYDYALEGQPLSLAANAGCLTFVTNGLSKILGLPQMKLSWIVVSGPELERREALKRLDVIADTYLSVNTPVQTALPSWLALAEKIQAQIRERVEINLELFKTCAKEMDGVNVLFVEGGWYAMLALPDILDEEEWALKFLRDAGVSVHPGYFFDAEGGTLIIVSLLLQTEQFQEGIQKIFNLIKIELSNH